MPLPNDYPPFMGFTRTGLDFLSELKTYNNRAWFKARKDTFDAELHNPLVSLAAELILRLPEETGIPVQGDPKKALFRIYRDTRFSKDKSPYKTNLGAFFTRSGTRDDNGGLYLHIEPDKSFAGGGFYKTDNSLVWAWRREMAREPARFLDIADKLAASGREIIPGDPLKKIPRGIRADETDRIAPYLKARWMYTSSEIDDRTLLGPSLVNEMIEMAKAVRPLLEWGWEAEQNMKSDA